MRKPLDPPRRIAGRTRNLLCHRIASDADQFCELLHPSTFDAPLSPTSSAVPANRHVAGQAHGTGQKSPEADFDRPADKRLRT